MDIVESINRYLAGSPTNKSERTRLTRARDEIVRLRTASQEAINGRTVKVDWKAQALELRELVRLGGIKIAELEAELAGLPAQQEPVALAHKHINATLAAFGPGEAISMTKETWAKLREAMSVLIEQTPQREPVVLKWQQAPIQTAWGDDMVVASIAIDKDHTLSLYCERDQAPKVEAMFAQRTWVGLTDEEKRQIFEREDYQGWLDYINTIEAKLKEKNNG